jgi:hypothetical protein
MSGTSSIEEASRELALEDYKFGLARRLEDHKSELARNTRIGELESKKVEILWRGVIEYGQTCVRTVIIANGAGATAMLAYLGNVTRQGAPVAIPVPRFELVALSACVFATGVVLGCMASMFAYFSQFKRAGGGDLTLSKASHRGEVERRVAVACAIAGLGLFVGGLFIAVCSYRT